MRDWDNKEEVSKRDVGKVFFFLVIVFCAGFIAGIFWGLGYLAIEQTDNLAVKAFAEEVTISLNNKTTLNDTMSFGDSITVRLLNGTT